MSIAQVLQVARGSLRCTFEGLSAEASACAQVLHDISRARVMSRSALLLIFVVAHAAAADPTAGTGGSIVDLKAAAYDAQQKADAAAAEAQQARQRLDEAETASAATSPISQQEVEDLRRDVDAAQHDAREAREQANEAREEATRANNQAEAARRELEDHKRKEKLKYARPGVFVGGTIYHAREHFDVDVGVGDSKGYSAIVGYRAMERFSFSVQFDKVDTFDVTGSKFRGDVDMWSIMINGKFYLLTRVFQPYVGVGIGGVRAKLKLKGDNGQSASDTESAGILKFSGGFDLYLTESLAVTGDASVHLPGGDISDLVYTTLGAGVKFRF